MSLAARPSVRLVGPISIVTSAIAMAVVWQIARPTDLKTGNSLGQLAGVESILLMSIALVLISTLPWVESYFDGIDRAAIWHRRCAIAGILLLVPHILMSHRRQAGCALVGEPGRRRRHGRPGDPDRLGHPSPLAHRGARSRPADHRGAPRVATGAPGLPAGQ